MAIACTLIDAPKLNEVDPQVWLTWILDCIADHKVDRLNELTAWSYAAKGSVSGIVAAR